MIAIYANANQKIGFGHVMRQISLIEELLERMCSVKLFTLGLPPELYSKLREKGLQICQIENEYELIDLLTADDVLIIDDYHVPPLTIEKLNGSVKQLIMFDDGVHGDILLLDVVVNSSDVYKSIHNSTVFLQGIEYRLIRSEFKLFRSKRTPVEYSVFISLGGTDVKMLTSSLCEMLSSVSNKLKITVAVTSSCDPRTLSLLRKLEKEHNIFLYINSENIPKLMSQSDIAITSAGGTLYELMYVGVPTIALVVVDNQKQALDSPLNNKAYISIDLRKELNLTEVVNQAIELLNSDDKKLSMHIAGKAAIDGLAAKRIADAICS